MASLHINNHGLIVGESQFSGFGVYRGWISLAGFNGLAELNTVTDLGTFQSVYKALAVNDRDAIVGIGLISSGTGETHGILLRPNE